ncbi:MAG: AglZ/HisF2 family acetamidino modification protein [Bacteroidia bacterium]
MLFKRVIPILLLKGEGLYKTQKFKDPKYIGDPLNAIKIFNDKEVDEVCVLDIEASNKKSINFNLIEKMASECFMPLSYGGGIASIEDASKLFSIGVEKLVINSSNFKSLDLVTSLSKKFGNQAIIASIDVKSNLFSNYSVFKNNGKDNTGFKPLQFALKCIEAGAGEILLNNIERDGMMNGLDIKLIDDLAKSISVPLIACGGIGNIDHIKEVFTATKVNAVAAGSMFVFHGKHRAILISYPNLSEII